MYIAFNDTTLVRAAKIIIILIYRFIITFFIFAFNFYTMNGKIGFLSKNKQDK